MEVAVQKQGLMLYFWVVPSARLMAESAFLSRAAVKGREEVPKNLGES